MTLESAVAETLAEYEEIAPDSREVLAVIRTRVAASRSRSLRQVIPVLAAAAAVVVIALAAVVLNLRDSGHTTSANEPPAGFGPAATRRMFQYNGPTEPGDLIPAARRERAEALTITLLDREGTFTLAAHRGHVVVLTWSATWCGPCRTAYTGAQQQPTLNSATTDLLTIATKDDRTNAQQFFRANPTGFDAQGFSLKQLGKLPAALPLTVLIDRDQLVAAVYISPVTTATLRASIDRLSGH